MVFKISPPFGKLSLAAAPAFSSLAALVLPITPQAKAVGISSTGAGITHTKANKTAFQISPQTAAHSARAIRMDLHPFWNGRIMYKEPLFFLKGKSGSAPKARLLFVPTRIISITSSSGGGRRQFRVGRDYQWKPGTNAITLTRSTRIPFMTWAQTHPPVGAPMSLGKAVGAKQACSGKKGHIFKTIRW